MDLWREKSTHYPLRRLLRICLRSKGSRLYFYMLAANSPSMWGLLLTYLPRKKRNYETYDILYVRNVGKCFSFMTCPMKNFKSKEVGGLVLTRSESN